MTEKNKIKVETRPPTVGYKDWDSLHFTETFEKYLDIFDVLVAPIVVGLYGSWGSGKTEIIKALSEELESRKYLTYVFDAWKYRKEENILLPLLQGIAGKHKKLPTVLQKSVKNIMTAVALTSLNQASKHFIGIGVNDVKQKLEFAEIQYKHYEMYKSKIDELDKDFKSLVNGLVVGRSKFVVFVDNLDRCLPEHVLNLLEDIANFLHSENCIFVFSMDKTVVVQAVQEKYKSFNGERYLEKIIQLGLNMPEPGINKDGSSQAIYHFMKRYERAVGYEKESVSGDPRDQVCRNLKDAVSLLFSDGFLNNPRRIEKYVNKFVALQKMKLLDMEKHPENVAFVMMLMVLKDQFPQVYGSITEKRDIETLSTFLNWSVTEDKTPLKFKHEGFAGENNHFANQQIAEEYVNNNQFYKFLKLFHQVHTTKGELSDPNVLVTKYFPIRQVVSIID